MRNIGLQIHSFQRLPLSFHEKLAVARRAGYEVVELTRMSVPDDAAEAAESLRRHGLEVVANTTLLRGITGLPQDYLDYQRAIGNHRIVIAVLTHDEIGDRGPNAWQNVGRELDDIGRQLRDEGFELGLHNHLLELQETSGRLGIDWLLEATAPENLFVELDLAWVRRAGLEPADLVSRFSGRLPLVHIKEPSDGTNPPDEVTTASPTSFDEMVFQLRAWHPHEPYVGTGNEDWSAVTKATTRAGVLCHLVEYEGLQDAEEAARRGFNRLSAELA